MFLSDLVLQLLVSMTKGKKKSTVSPLNIHIERSLVKKCYLSVHEIVEHRHEGRGWQRKVLIFVYIITPNYF